MCKKLYKPGFTLCTLVCIFLFACCIHTEAKAATITAEVTSVEDSCTYVADAVGKNCTVIKDYNGYVKLLGKIEKYFSKKCPGVPVTANDAYNAITGCNKKFFKKYNLCIFIYDIPDTGKTTFFENFYKQTDGGKVTAVCDVFRTSYLRGIENKSSSYYIVKVKKSDVSDVESYACNETVYTAPVRSDSEYEWALQNAQPVSEASESEKHIISANIAAAANMDSDIAAKVINKNVKVIKSYKQYQKLISKIKKFGKNTKNNEFCSKLMVYNKEYFNKNTLCIFKYKNSNTGWNTRAGKIMKEEADGKAKIVFTVTGLPYYGGQDSMSYSYYFASIKKKDLKGIKDFECRRVTLFEEAAVNYAASR